MTTQSKHEELRKRIKKAQSDLVWRRATHLKIARISGWTPTDLDGVHDGDQIIFENDVIGLINSEVLAVLDRVQQSIDQHATPEGKDLLTRSYINNTLAFERDRHKPESR